MSTAVSQSLGPNFLALPESSADYPNAPSMPEPKILAQLRTFQKDEYDEEVDHNDPLIPLKGRVTVVGKTDFSTMSYFTFPKLEEFIIGSELCSASHVKQLAQLLPNVKRLRIRLNNESFRAVCLHWSELEELDASPLNIDDECLTGIVEGDPTAARLSNITYLKRLRRFGMGEAIAKTEKVSEITDFSLKNWLLKLQYLETVSLFCSRYKMSEDTFSKLKERFASPNSTLYRSDAASI